MNPSNLSNIKNLKIIEENADFTIYKIAVNSNIYFIDGKYKVLIDCGDRFYFNQVSEIFEKLTDSNKIDAIILTHLHYDHIGCLDLFPNAKLFAHPKEIDSFYNDNFGTVLNNNIITLLKSRELLPITDFLAKFDLGFEFEVISTPGHTCGSMCLYSPKYNLLFTGDTFFGKDIYGRVDLPSSVPELMGGSLKILEKYKSAKIFPGHDY